MYPYAVRMRTYAGNQITTGVCVCYPTSHTCNNIPPDVFVRCSFLCLHTLVTIFQLVYAFVIRALAVRFLLLYAHVVRVTSHAGNHIIPGVCVRCPCDFTCWQSDVHGVCIRCPTRIPLVYAYTVYASQAGNHISSGKCVHCLCWQPDSPWFMRTLFI